MKSQYNLINEKWIPCIDLNGKLCKFSLREALVDAHKIGEIYHNSPPVVASLHRLLLSIIHRVFDPCTDKKWIKLWNNEQFDTTEIDNYLNKWNNRFFVFDDKFPFYQTIDDEIGKCEPMPITKMISENSTATQKTLFDHSFDCDNKSIDIGEAVCQLISHQNYCLAAGISHKNIKNISNRSGNLLAGAIVLLQGESLFHTLVLNAVTGNPIPEIDKNNNVPWWEKVKFETGAPEKVPSGYMDYLTWRGKKVRLISNGNGETNKVVTIQAERVTRDSLLEPMFAYFNKKVKDEDVKYPYNIRADKAVWRDSNVLFLEAGKTESGSSQNVKQLARLIEKNTQLENHRIWINVMGIDAGATKRKINLWRHEKMRLYPEMLNDEDAVVFYENIIDKAEQISKCLASIIINKVEKKTDFSTNVTGNFKKKKREPLLANRAKIAYWSNLEPLFFETLGTFMIDSDKAIKQWKKYLRNTALDAFETFCGNVDKSARLTEAYCRGKDELCKKLNIIL